MYSILVYIFDIKMYFKWNQKEQVNSNLTTAEVTIELLK